MFQFPLSRVISHETSSHKHICTSIHTRLEKEEDTLLPPPFFFFGIPSGVRFWFFRKVKKPHYVFALYDDDSVNGVAYLHIPNPMGRRRTCGWNVDSIYRDDVILYKYMSAYSLPKPIKVGKIGLEGE